MRSRAMLPRLMAGTRSVRNAAGRWQERTNRGQKFESARPSACARNTWLTGKAETSGGAIDTRAILCVSLRATSCTSRGILSSGARGGEATTTGTRKCGAASRQGAGRDCLAPKAPMASRTCVGYSIRSAVGALAANAT